MTWIQRHRELGSQERKYANTYANTSTVEHPGSSTFTLCSEGRYEKPDGAVRTNKEIQGKMRCCMPVTKTPRRQSLIQTSHNVLDSFPLL